MNESAIPFIRRGLAVAALLSIFPTSSPSQSNEVARLFEDESPEVVVNQGEAILQTDSGNGRPCFLSIEDRIAVTTGEIRKASFETYGELLIWDLAEGRLAHRLELPARLWSIAGIRGTGRLVVVGGPVNKDFNPPFVAVVDLREGEVTAQLPALHEWGSDYDLRLTPDGRFAVMRDRDHHDPDSFEPATRYLAYAIPAPGESPQEPRLANEAMWKELAPLSSDHPAKLVTPPNWIRHLGDVDAGFALATDDLTTALWRTDTWEKVIDLGAFTPPWQDWVPSLDGQRLLSWRRNTETRLVLWDFDTFRVTSFDAPGFYPGIPPAFSPDNRFLRYVICDANSDRLVVKSRHLASNRENIDYEETIEPFEHFHDATIRGKFSANGRHLLLVHDESRDAVLLTWGDDGTFRRKKLTAPEPVPVLVADDGSAAGFAPTRGNDRGDDVEFTVQVIELDSGSSLHRWSMTNAGHPPNFNGAIDANGALVLTQHTIGASLGYYSGNAVSISGNEEIPIPGFQVSPEQHPTERYGHAWSTGFCQPRGSTDALATVYASLGRFVTFDHEKSQVVHDYRWQDFSPLISTGASRRFPTATRVVAREGGRAFLPIRDGGIRVIDLLAGGTVAHRAHLWSLPGKGWFAVTPDGPYACSVGSERHVFFKRGDEIHPFEQFDAQLNRPDVVAAALGAETPEVEALKRAHRRRLATLGENASAEVLEPESLPTIAFPDRPSMIHDSPEFSLRFEAKAPSDTKLRQLEFFANGVPIHPQGDIDISGRETVSGTVVVALAPGENLIEARVGDERGRASALSGLRVHRSTRGARPELYLVTIGVADYRDDDFDLTFPAKDADDLGAALEKAASGFAKVHRKAIVDSEATRESILSANSFLRLSQPGDRVIIFLGGHGLLDEQYRYYFATTDIDFEEPSGRGLSYEEIESLFDQVPARERLLLMDTCQAGSVDGALLKTLETGEADLPESVEASSTVGLRAAAAITPATQIEGQRFVEELFRDLKKGTGATVVTASGGLEFAYESADWSNGIFTYAVINTIDQPDVHDRDEDGLLRTSELVTAVSDTVSELTRGHQNPTARDVNLKVDFPVTAAQSIDRLEEPTDFLKRYLSLSSDNFSQGGASIEHILRFFADRVDYFDDSMNHAQIAKDIRDYNETYPERTYRIKGTPKVTFSDGETAATLDYEMAFKAGYDEEEIGKAPDGSPMKFLSRAYREGELSMRMKIRRTGREWRIEALSTR